MKLFQVPTNTDEWNVIQSTTCGPALSSNKHKWGKGSATYEPVPISNQHRGGKCCNTCGHVLSSNKHRGGKAYTSI